MPRHHFIEFNGCCYTISELACLYQIKTGTLSNRIKRFGETTTGIMRALTTGIQSRSDAGKKGASNSNWRFNR